MKALISILAISVLGALLAGATSANPTAERSSTVGTLAVASNRDGNAEIYLMTETGRNTLGLRWIVPAPAHERPEVRRGSRVVS